MNPAPRPSTVPRLLKVRDVAALLGVTVRTVQTWIGVGRLPAVRLSPRVVRIAESDVASLVARSTDRPAPPKMY